MIIELHKIKLRAKRKPGLVFYSVSSHMNLKTIVSLFDFCSHHSIYVEAVRSVHKDCGDSIFSTIG